MNIGLFAALMGMFLLGLISGVMVVLATRVKGEITIDKEHYSTPATLFTLYEKASDAFGSKYVMFRVQEGDLREKFGPDIKLNKGDFEDAFH